MTQEVLQQILDCGAQAPSGDNLQPWRVDWRGERIRLSVDASRDRSLYNFRQQASLIALGAMAENMAIAALEHGLSTTVEVSETSPGSLPVVSLTFSEAVVPRDPLYPAIPRRCTNRKAYRTAALDEHLLTALRQASPAEFDASLLFVQDRRQMRLVARGASLNDRLLYELRPLHDQFYETIRWTEREAERSRDGLFIRTLELGPMGAGFRAMRSWKLVSVLNRLGWFRFAPIHSFRTFMRSGAFGYLRTSASTPRAFIDGGRALQRIWLTATALGLGFQPMAGSLYLLAYLQRGVTSPLTEPHRKVLARAAALLGQVLPLQSREVPIILFRVGHAHSPSARSLRKALGAH